MARRTLYDENGEPVEVDLEDDGGDAEDGEPTRSDWAKLRQATKARERAEKETAAAKREVAFVRAGLNLDDARVQDFAKAYDGELTRDAVTAAARERGYLTETGEQPGGEGPAPDVSALAAQQRIVSASAGATPDLRDDTQRLAEAHAQGGRAALVDELRGLGFPIVVEGQT